MPLLGKAAMLLTFDVEQDAISEHDDCTPMSTFPNDSRSRASSEGLGG